MSPFPGQIARANAPARTRMEMPAHLSAMIGNPRPRKPIVAKPVSVAMDAIEYGRRVEDAAKEKAEREAVEKLKEAMRRAEQTARREHDRRRKLGLLDVDNRDYRRHPRRAMRLIKIASEMMGYRVEDLQGKNRNRQLVYVRHICMWIVRRNCREFSRNEPVPLPRIGRIFGGRDHSTVIHALKRVEGNIRMLATAQEIEVQVLKMERDTYA